MPFSPVYAIGSLRFYEAKNPLRGGQESLARAVENVTDCSTRAVYRFPIEVDPIGYRRFFTLAQYANSGFGTQIPTTPVEFQNAYQANQRWEVWSGKVRFGINNADRRACIAEQIAEQFLEYDSGLLTVIPQIISVFGVQKIAEERRQNLQQEFNVDGLDAVQRIGSSIGMFATTRAREGLTQLSASAFLDLTEHEKGLVLKGNELPNLAEAQRIENDLVALYNSV